MNSKNKFLINASIISIYNIALSIFFLIQTRGDFITVYFILPTILFIILYVVTLIAETDFQKKSYKISHISNYVAIIATIIIILGIYSLKGNSSPGVGFILFIFGALWVIPIVVALISYFIGFFSKSEQIYDSSKLTKPRSLFFVLNTIVGVFYLFLFVITIFDYTNHDNKANINFAIFIPIFVLLISSFLTRRKSSALYWTIQIITIILTTYLTLSVFGFSLTKMQSTPNYPMTTLSSPLQ